LLIVSGLLGSYGFWYGAITIWTKILAKFTAMDLGITAAIRVREKCPSGSVYLIYVFDFPPLYLEYQ
jgi:hypothetical protein